MRTYHLKKRIDIVVEAPLTRTVANLLDTVEVTGYSVLPILEGRGIVNAWTSEGQLSNTANMVVVLCIVDPSKADTVIEGVLGVIHDRIGFVTVADAFVVRPERF